VRGKECVHPLGLCAEKLSAITRISLRFWVIDHEIVQKRYELRRAAQDLTVLVLKAAQRDGVPCSTPARSAPKHAARKASLCCASAESPFS
jgi:hypothetical protein